MDNAKRPGRPPIDPERPPARVHVTIPAATYDTLYKTARAQGQSVPALIRATLAGNKQPKNTG